jgi:hypothetical protein
MEPLLKSILSKEALQQMAEPTWGAFPVKGLGTKTWTKTSKLDLGPIGLYETTFNYTLEGQDDKKREKIGVKAELKYKAPTGKNGLPFTIKSADLSSKEGTGTAFFDRAKGRIDESSMKMVLKGTLKIEVGGMETEVALDQNQTATVKTSDEEPAELKKKAATK